jgi:hypothetical protein
MDLKQQVEAASDHLNETGVHTDHNVNLEVVISKDEKFKDKYVLSGLVQ